MKNDPQTTPIIPPDEVLEAMTCAYVGHTMGRPYVQAGELNRQAMRKAILTAKELGYELKKP